MCKATDEVTGTIFKAVEVDHLGGCVGENGRSWPRGSSHQGGRQTRTCSQQRVASAPDTAMEGLRRSRKGWLWDLGVLGGGAEADGCREGRPHLLHVSCTEASGFGEGLREATGSLAVHPQPPLCPLCLPGALGGHAQGGWPTASSSSCCRDRRELALIEPLSSLPQSPGHRTQRGL